jgi:hypothetical protein
LFFCLLLNYPNSPDLITNLNNDGLANAAGAFFSSQRKPKMHAQLTYEHKSTQV